eukprot:CAMPEP_0117755164 /NCGR_PEP_ID=MMETSP0947-20121206/13283_1 /TAXON_ID=44440 /ORGANISM="Chattonella subsalsa, Strain CCMP2191" /LENGTH=309 /DNA_ID=CAMNT_0005574435 /DNA_START=63 /DNA_END=992 /DNA_ORIENTATION=+
MAIQQFSRFSMLFVITCLTFFSSVNSFVFHPTNTGLLVNAKRCPTLSDTACVDAPSNTKVEITEQNAKSVLISWPEIEHASSYKVKFQRTETDAPSSWITTASNEARLDNLQPGEKYSLTIEPFGTSIEPVTAEFSTKEEFKSTGELTSLSRMEMRVGKILDIAPHPEADSLYIETVDVGESQPRTIVSGLRKYCTEEQLKGSLVVVLCNLKPRAMRGVDSAGMLLCASNEEHTEVDPLTPPEGSIVGEIITFEGHQVDYFKPGLRANRAYEEISSGLYTTEDGTATYNGIPFATSAGPCTSKIVGSIA